MQDTGVATTTTGNKTAFQRLRIEVASSSPSSSGTATFLINGQVTNILSGQNMPVEALVPMVSIGVGNYQNTIAHRIGINDLDIQYIKVWIDDPPVAFANKTSTPSGVVNKPSVSLDQEDTPLDQIGGSSMALRYTAGSDKEKLAEGMIISGAQNGADVSLSSKPYDSNIIGAISMSSHVLTDDSNKSSVLVGEFGRVSVKVTLANGAIKKGDRITSSNVEGYGMRASRPGYILGRALEDFDPVHGNGYCDGIDPVVASSTMAMATSTDSLSFCKGNILVNLKPNFDMGISDAIADLGAVVKSAPEAMLDMADSVFEKGLNTAKLVMGKVVAQVGVFKNLFASSITVIPDGKITLPSGENQAVGQNIFPAGAMSILVLNTQVASTSKIFVTPRISVVSPFSVTRIDEGKGFVVSTITAPVSSVPFDWMIINSYKANDSQGGVIIESTGSTNSSSSNSSTVTNPSSTVVNNDQTNNSTTTPVSSTNTESTTTPSGNSDNIAPVISINGANPAKISVGTSYVDLGATVTDNIDHNLGITVTGDSIDTRNAGTYTVTYSATDQAGNSATSTRSVIVENIRNDSLPIIAPVSTSTPVNNTDVVTASGSEVVSGSETTTNNGASN
jgi:hypothetical protein